MLLRSVSTRLLPLCRRNLPLAFPRRAFGLTPTPVPVFQRFTPRRPYSDTTARRLEEEGLPLPKSGPTKAALVGYAEAQWMDLAPRYLPAGWSTAWKDWDYLLTLFAYSPYFLRLPQIEMLVNVQYAIAGEVKPIAYNSDKDAVIFAVYSTEDPEYQSDAEQSDSEEGGGGSFSVEIFYLNYRTFSIYSFDAEHAPNVPPPQSIEELVDLMTGAESPESVPLYKLDPDPEGQAALDRILARDASVIPELQEKYLAYEPRPTTEAEEIPEQNEVERERKARLAEAIENTRRYIREAEDEFLAEQEETRKMKEQEGMEMAETQDEQQAYAEIRTALDDAKTKLREMEQVWNSRYAPDRI
ncbi:hypothetical protein MKEN_00598200 [Mycena kentingensis (nom. inval.)]|nr:hypothetical protein MKEN_00598200 [Mycena kentingensis (nom. inval.)]